MPTIEISGTTHRYELSSADLSKPTLVFIHGWLLSRHYWQPLIERLSPHYCCLSYDLRGFGESQPGTIPANHSLAAYAGDLIILLEQLNIDSAWLVGHSLGGTIALWAAHECGERVKGVICLNSGGGIYLKEEFERFRNAGEQILKQRPGWLPNVPLIDLVFARMMVKQPLSREWGRQRVLDFVRADHDAALGSLLESTTKSEVHLLPQIVNRLQQPVYFIAGKDDTVMELKYVKHLASFHHLFNSCNPNVVEIENCGHLAMIEQPAMVAQTIHRFLS
ncbi:MAG: alpha/beta hydrolase [Chlorogloea purpurea SAG 13.99]|nr:alpha/beta hydrolase [Chlorogloea purpurea SAG 13.99]